MKNNISKTNYFLLIILMVITMLLFSKAVYTMEYYALSDDGISVYSFHDGKLNRLYDLLDRSKWRSVVYPTWNPVNNSIVFEAGWHLDNVAIYEVSIKDLRIKSVPRKLIYGRLPSLSPDGHRLAYLAENKYFIITEFPFRIRTMTISDVHVSKPIVWLDNERVIYQNQYRGMTILNVSTKNSYDFKINNLMPISKLPNTATVMCINSDDNSGLFLLDTNNNQLTQLLKYNEWFKLSIGASIVWLPDGKSFFYTRQTWGNQLRLSESHHLFLRQLDGKEIQLIEKFALFGGVLIENAD